MKQQTAAVAPRCWTGTRLHLPPFRQAASSGPHRQASQGITHRQTGYQCATLKADGMASGWVCGWLLDRCRAIDDRLREDGPPPNRRTTQGLGSRSELLFAMFAHRLFVSRPFLDCTVDTCNAVAYQRERARALRHPFFFKSRPKEAGGGLRKSPTEGLKSRLRGWLFPVNALRCLTKAHGGL